MPPSGFEPEIPVPKTGVISISPRGRAIPKREQIQFAPFNYNISMTTITSTSTLILLLTSLIHANSLNLISSQKINDFLQEIYFQPYAEFSKDALYLRYPEINSWKRPQGQLTIALQVGHLLEDELPLELRQLAKGGGAKKGLVKEVEFNQNIVQRVSRILISKGYKVQTISALVPPSYYADVFISVHANSAPKSVSGFMISTPLIDYSEKGKELKWALIQEYASSTGMMYLDQPSDRMTSYYSFNWSRFKRTIHPKTPAVIIETGNMNNPNDLVNLTLRDNKIAEGIANGIISFLQHTYTPPEGFE